MEIVGPLHGVRVVELSSGISGPYCGKLLAGMGADVVKIERPRGGDSSRMVGPFPGDYPDPESSGLFLYLNTAKQSVTIDPVTPSGSALVRQIATSADVLLESYPPGTLDGWGLGYDVLVADNPRLVYASVTNFGQTGPYRDFKATEITEYALSSLMSITGEPDREPLKLGGSISLYVAGQTAAVATLAALYEAEESGHGQYVDVSTLEANVAIAEFNHVLYAYRGIIDERKGNRHANHPWGIYPCIDGWVGVIAGPTHRWGEMAKLMDERLADPRFATLPQRTEPEARDELDAIILPWLVERTKKEIYHAGQAHGLAFAYVATAGDLLQSEQLLTRSYFATVDHPRVGPHTFPGAPFRCAETPWRVERAPLLGEHNDAVLVGELGLSRADLMCLRESGVI
ncbi:MAG: CaiB/BaiF CoA transferase family protein [Dehalococcoidia bacterium]